VNGGVKLVVEDGGKIVGVFAMETAKFITDGAQSLQAIAAALRRGREKAVQDGQAPLDNGREQFFLALEI
jgi:hypothetical protein